MSMEFAPDEHAPQEEAPRPERFAKLRKQLEKLARWGVMASALSGVLPPGVAAQENDAARQAWNAAKLEQLEIAKQRVGIQRKVGEEKFALLMNPPGTIVSREVNREVPVVGFERYPEKAQTIRTVLAAAPASLVRQVAEINHDQQAATMPATYGMSVENELAAHVGWADHRITFLAGADKLGPFIFSDVLEHELCHFGDPSMDRNLKVADRVRLYGALLDRSVAPDRFRSSYVENIRNRDAQVQMSNRAGEYWAETCGAYLRGDPLLPDADRELVNAVLLAADSLHDEEALTHARKDMNSKLRKLSDQYSWKLKLKPARR